MYYTQNKSIADTGLCLWTTLATYLRPPNNIYSSDFNHRVQHNWYTHPVLTCMLPTDDVCFHQGGEQEEMVEEIKVVAVADPAKQVHTHPQSKRYTQRPPTCMQYPREIWTTKLLVWSISQKGRNSLGVLYFSCTGVCACRTLPWKCCKRWCSNL